MSATLTPQTLNEQFGIPHTVRFEAGPGDLIRAVITGETATAVVYLLGGHVAEYEPVGHKDLLWMSNNSDFRIGSPIRGGVPVCFPWFAAKASDPGAAMHGLARTRMWDVISATEEGDHVTLELATQVDNYHVTHRIVIGPSLQMTLRVQNTGHTPARFEEALHTYFSVSQIQNIEIAGLENASYHDKTNNFALTTQDDQPIRFASETDRVYNNTTATCTLTDPGMQRIITVEKENSNSTIVWNPWIDKAAAMPDFGDNEWPSMVCIETANVSDDAIELQPGETHEMTARITASKL